MRRSRAVSGFDQGTWPGSTRVNVNGGAVALGHPIGASGTRVLVTLIYELIRRNGKRGIAALCLVAGIPWRWRWRGFNQQRHEGTQGVGCEPRK